MEEKRETKVKVMNLTKKFDDLLVLDHISFDVKKGEFLCIVGPTGCGKTTFLNSLTKLYQPTSGEILINNEPVDLNKHSVAYIFQEYSTMPWLTVEENVRFGLEIKHTDQETTDRKVNEYLEVVGLTKYRKYYPDQLSASMLQRVVIARAFATEPELLLMDEPYGQLDIELRFKLEDELLNLWKRNGTTVIFITHKMKEVMEVADRIIVMRNGRLTGDLTADETSEVELARLMMGKEMVVAKREENEGDRDRKVCLELQNVTVRHRGALPVLNDLSFQIMEGEIFGVAGVSGNGQEELCEVICGALPVSSGRVFLKGRDITSTSVRERISLGIGYVPVDRYRDAMVGEMTLAENMMLKTSFDRKWTDHGFLNRKKLHEYTLKAIKDFEIKAPGPDAQIRGLSGGNQQKVILAREVNNAGEMLVMDQPTRGLDLGAINNIHTNILEERRKGKSILLVSTELSEIFELCDRIAVIYKGAFMGIYRHDELTTERIGLLMAGYKEEKGA